MKSCIFVRSLRALLFTSLVTLLVTTACTPASSHGGAHTSSPLGTDGQHRELAQAQVYETDRAREPLRGEAVDRVLTAALERGCRAGKLLPDGRLADLALAIVSTSGASRPSGAAVTYHAERAGLGDPTPQMWLASAASTEVLAPLLEHTIRDATGAYALTHCGAAAIRVGGAVVVGLALSKRAYTLHTPVPRSSAPGAAIPLHGELARGYRGPELAITEPSGGVRRKPLGKQRKFNDVFRPTEIGEYTLELLADGPEGYTVVAMFPVFVGVPIATLAVDAEEAEVESSASEVAANLLALIASERAKRNLPPLRDDPRLRAIAQAHSEDMVRNRFIAHTSSRSGDATTRIKSAGLQATVVLENIGRAYSARELHQGLMQSPGHRGNILHPDAREIGIGVVAEREGERHAFIATELFTQLAQ